MTTFKIIFSLLSFLCTVYAVFCTIKIILTWIPGTNMGFTRFLSAICDPYLKLVSKTRILHFGQLDFSPVLALGILALLSTVFSGIATEGKLGLGTVIGLILQMSFYTATSLLNFFILFLIIRCIVLISSRTAYTTSQFWQQFDYFISPIVYKLSRFFSGGKMLSFKATLLISIVFFIATSIITSLVMSKLIQLVHYIPF